MTCQVLVGPLVHAVNGRMGGRIQIPQPQLVVDNLLAEAVGLHQLVEVVVVVGGIIEAQLFGEKVG